MPLTSDSYFENSYTFTIADSGAFSPFEDLITRNAVAVIDYIADYISWEGTLDFAVQFAAPTTFGFPGTGLLPAIVSRAETGDTGAAFEAFTGTDPDLQGQAENSLRADLGAYILPNLDGRLTNYDVPLYFDDSPDAYEVPQVPAGTHDFFSIYLHEVLHGLGFYSLAQSGPQFGTTRFDDLTVERDGQFYFTGPATRAVLGADLPLAVAGSRDHYGRNINGDNPVERGAMFEFGNYEQNRWQLGQVELAVLEDLGFTTANSDLLALTDQPDSSVAAPRPGLVTRATGDGADNLRGGAGNDILDGAAGDDTLRSGDGADTVIGGTGRDLIQTGRSSRDLRDVVYAGDGDDTIDGGYGNDLLRGDAGDDSVTGGFGADTLIGAQGNDTLSGAALSDEIFGGDGADFINGGFGSDRLNGGDGADLFYHLGIEDHGSDWIQDFAGGTDRLFYGQAATAEQFQINTAATQGAGDADIAESFIIYRPTGQILWALVDGNAEAEISLLIDGSVISLTG